MSVWVRTRVRVRLRVRGRVSLQSSMSRLGLVGRYLAASALATPCSLSFAYDYSWVKMYRLFV